MPNDKIPDDIMMAATAALNDMPVGLMNWNEVRRATARAILAERERCAKIAEATASEGNAAVALILAEIERLDRMEKRDDR